MFDKFKNIGFNTRILLGYSVIIVMMIVIINISLYQFSKNQAIAGIMQETGFPLAMMADDMVNDIVTIQNDLTDVAATHHSEGLIHAEQIAQDFRADIQTFRARAHFTPQKLHQLNAIEATFDRFYSTGKHMASVYISQGVDAGNLVMVDFDHAEEVIKKQIGDFRQEEVNVARDTIENLVSTSLQSSRILLWISVLLIVVALVVALPCYFRRLIMTSSPANSISPCY
jgi:methyl-accepting chemotaxis protein